MYSNGIDILAYSYIHCIIAFFNSNCRNHIHVNACETVFKYNFRTKNMINIKDGKRYW